MAEDVAGIDVAATGRAPAPTPRERLGRLLRLGLGLVVLGLAVRFGGDALAWLEYNEWLETRGVGDSATAALLGLLASVLLFAFAWQAYTTMHPEAWERSSIGRGLAQLDRAVALLVTDLVWLLSHAGRPFRLLARGMGAAAALLARVGAAVFGPPVRLLLAAARLLARLVAAVLDALLEGLNRAARLAEAGARWLGRALGPAVRALGRSGGRAALALATLARLAWAGLVWLGVRAYRGLALLTRTAWLVVKVSASAFWQAVVFTAEQMLWPLARMARAGLVWLATRVVRGVTLLVRGIWLVAKVTVGVLWRAVAFTAQQVLWFLAKQTWLGLAWLALRAYRGLALLVRAVWLVVKVTAGTLWRAIRFTLAQVLWPLVRLAWSGLVWLVTRVAYGVTRLVRAVWLVVKVTAGALWRAIRFTLAQVLWPLARLVWGSLVWLGVRAYRGLALLIRTAWLVVKVTAGALWRAVAFTAEQALWPLVRLAWAGLGWAGRRALRGLAFLGGAVWLLVRAVAGWLGSATVAAGRLLGRGIVALGRALGSLLSAAGQSGSAATGSIVALLVAAGRLAGRPLRHVASALWLLARLGARLLVASLRLLGRAIVAAALGTGAGLTATARGAGWLGRQGWRGAVALGRLAWVPIAALALLLAAAARLCWGQRRHLVVAVQAILFALSVLLSAAGRLLQLAAGAAGRALSWLLPRAGRIARWLASLLGQGLRAGAGLAERLAVVSLRALPRLLLGTLAGAPALLALALVVAAPVERAAALVDCEAAQVERGLAGDYAVAAPRSFAEAQLQRLRGASWGLWSQLAGQTRWSACFPPGTLVVAYSPDKAALFQELVAGFNAGRPAGAPAIHAVKLEPAAMLEPAGDGRLGAISPDSDLWLSELERRWQARHPGAAPLVGRTARFARSPLVIAMRESEARRLGVPDRPVGWETLAERARLDLGYRWSHPSPATTVGLLATAAVFHDAAGQRGSLLPADLDDAATLARVREVEGTVRRYAGDSEEQLAADLAAGVSRLDAFVAPEQTVVAANARSGGRRLRAVYPAGGTFVLEHPLALLEGPWLTEAERRLFGDFADYLAAPEQARRVLREGYRLPAGVEPPADAEPAVGPARGADLEQPQTALPLPDPGTLERVRQAWRATKRPANIYLVVDTSGSMGGEKIASARAALLSFVDQVEGEGDLVGLISFARQARVEAPLWSPRLSLTTIRTLLRRRVEALTPGGETALYDAVLLALKELGREADPARLNALVVLSDGRDTASAATLEQVVTALRRAEPPVLLLVVAYGDDADPAVLQELAAAGDGQVYTSQPATVQRLYELLARLF